MDITAVVQAIYDTQGFLIRQGRYDDAVKSWVRLFDLENGTKRYNNTSFINSMSIYLEVLYPQTAEGSITILEPPHHSEELRPKTLPSQFGAPRTRTSPSKPGKQSR